MRLLLITSTELKQPVGGTVERRSASEYALALMMLILLAGFWLRLSFWLGNVYYTDEFITMLAATMVARQGLPILPSGLFYDHGLLYTFLSGALVALLGFGEQIARWPALLISLFAIAAYYAAARRLFDSRLTGLLAAALAAFDASSIEWGSWARMYSLAQLFVLLVLIWLLLSTLKKSGRSSRYLCLLFLAGALFSHTVTFLILPPLAALLFVFTLVYNREWLGSPHLWRQALLGVAIVAIAVIVVSLGQVGSTVSIQDPDASVPAPLGLGFLRGFFLPGLEVARFERLASFFQTPAYTWLLYLIGLSLLLSLYRLWRSSATFADVAFLFLVLFSILVVLEMSVLLTRSWQKSHYLFILVLPAFILLAAESLSRVWRGLATRLMGGLLRPVPPGRVELLAALLGVGFVVSLWSGAAWEVARRRSAGDFNNAFIFVRNQWQPGDKVMTEHPAAAYLYLGRSDYYANQVSARVLESDDEDEALLVDRYVGSPLVDTVDRFNAALAGSKRVWFVVDDGHLSRRYEPFFQQQVFAQMDLVYQTGTRDVFLSRPYPTPLPAKPSVSTAANFNDTIILDGYSLNLTSLAPVGTILLGLYFRPVGNLPTHPFKVFVQLRNGLDQTVAQADHFIYEGLLDSRQWQVARADNEWLRDSADLHLPRPLLGQEGPYRIYVGFYDPVTLERAPLLNDTSGENAVVIVLPALP